MELAHEGLSPKSPGGRRQKFVRTIKACCSSSSRMKSKLLMVIYTLSKPMVICTLSKFSMVIHTMSKLTLAIRTLPKLPMAIGTLSKLPMEIRTLSKLLMVIPTLSKLLMMVLEDTETLRNNTVWKFYDFSITQILREINFWVSIKCKICQFNTFRGSEL